MSRAEPPIAAVGEGSPVSCGVERQTGLPSVDRASTLAWFASPIHVPGSPPSLNLRTTVDHLAPNLRFCAQVPFRLFVKGTFVLDISARPRSWLGLKAVR
jgi:hypothetical protein